MNRFCFILIFCTLPTFIFAQKNKKINYAFSKLEHIVVDASLDDWGENLHEMHGDLWSFNVSAVDNKLYFAVLIKDLQLQRDAFRGGIFVNISYNDKKKEGARIIFPYWDGERRRALANDEELRSKNIEQELLKNVNGYYLKGFAKVRDGVLALDNDYGIRAKVQMDSNKCLLYEAVVPLDLVGLKSDVVAIQLGVNTQFAMLRKAAENQNRNMPINPMYARPSVSNSIKNPYKGETEVWIIDKVN